MVDDDQHDRRQPVEPDRPVGRERPPALDEAQDLDLLGLAVEGEEDDPRQEGGEEQKAPFATQVAALSPSTFQPKPQISAPTRGAKRRIVSMAPLSPFITLASSTSIEPRVRKKADEDREDRWPPRRRRR